MTLTPEQVEQAKEAGRKAAHDRVAYNRNLPTPGKPCPWCGTRLTYCSPSGQGHCACDSCEIIWW